MKLPGAPPARRSFKHHSSGDEPTNASRWTSPDLQRAILDLLAAGPRAKWELREQLQVNEARIFAELKKLRDAGQVKAVGRRLIERRWALGSWQAAPVAIVTPARKVRHRLPRSTAERYADLLR